MANRDDRYSVHIRIGIGRKTRVLGGKRPRLTVRWRLGNQILNEVETKVKFHSVLDGGCCEWRDVAVET